MIIKEAEQFYKNDKKQYIMKNRPGFEKWYNTNYNENNAYLNIEEIQKLVNKIVSWYIFKFPNRMLNDSKIDMRFIKIPDISESMDIKQLLYRLSHSEYCVMDAKYRTSGGFVDSNNNINYAVDLSDRFDYILIRENGTINYESKQKYQIKSRDIEEFYEKYKNDPRFDMTKVKECINRHNNDLILRNHIIDAVKEGLLYEKHTTPENGIYRAKAFIKDILEYYGDIDLTISNKTVSEEPIEEPKKKIFKRLRRG